MSFGYSTTWFVTEPNSDVICFLCYDVLRDPKSCPSDHTFCGSCLDKAILVNKKCPICRYGLGLSDCVKKPHLRNRVNQMIVSCNFTSKTGSLSDDKCAWIGPLDLLENHQMNNCQYMTNNCKIGHCDAKYLKVFRAAHECECHSSSTTLDQVPSLASCEHINGDKYFGTQKYGLKHGQGETNSVTEGYKYKGEYRFGDRSGRGVCQYGNGDVYDGEWLDDLKHGRGTMTFYDGDVYSGEWRVGEMEGHGELRFPEGGGFIGQWVKGDMSCGEYTWEDGEVYRGPWKNGIQHGIGLQTKPGGWCYEGSFEKGLKSGMGRLILENGDVYSGNFTNDLPDGSGELLRAKRTQSSTDEVKSDVLMARSSGNKRRRVD